jgi:hypothetical protein
MESEADCGVETGQQELKAEHQQTLSSPREEEIKTPEQPLIAKESKS